MATPPPDPLVIFRGSEMVLLDEPEKVPAVLGVVRNLLAKPGVALAYGKMREPPAWIEDAASIPAVGPAFDELVAEWVLATGEIRGQISSDRARAAGANVRKQVLKLALRLGDLRSLRAGEEPSKWDDLPAGISLSWRRIGAEGQRIYHAVMVSVWVASANTGLARLQPPSATLGAPTAAARGGASFWFDRLREALFGFEAGLGAGRGFWQLTIGGRHVELPRFTSVWRTPLPQGVESYTKDEAGMRVMCRRNLMGGDPFSAEVSASVVEGNFLTLRRTTRIVEGSAQELYLLAPFVNGDEKEGELDREHHLITHQWETLYLGLIGELLAASTRGDDIDRVEGAVNRMESSLGRLEAAVTRVQNFLAAAEARERTTRREARRLARDRSRAFDLAGVLLERMHRMRPRLIVLSTDLDAIEKAASDAIDGTVADFQRALTTRPLPEFAQGTIEATREWEPVVALRTKVEALAARGRALQARVEVLSDATHNILETERREESRRSEERQTHLGEALALMALLTAVPLIIGSMDPETLAEAVARVLPGSEGVVLSVQPILTVVALVAAIVITTMLLVRFFREPRPPATVGASVARWGHVLSGRGQAWSAAHAKGDRAALLAEDERIARELAAYLDSLGSEASERADEIEALERSIERQVATVDLPTLIADIIPLPLTATLLCGWGVDGNGIVAPAQYRRSLQAIGWKPSTVADVLAATREAELRTLREVSAGERRVDERAATILQRIEPAVKAALAPAA